MDDKNIIIILLVVIILILACIVGYFLMPSLNGQKDCKLVITSDSSLNEGDNLTVMLCDMDGVGIVNQKIDVSIVGEDGTKDSYSLISDSDGVATVKLKEMEGNYTVECAYGGNENFTANSTSQALEIKGVAAESEPQQQTQESSDSSNGVTYDEKLNVYYDSNGVVVDPDGEHPMEVGRQYSDLVEREEKWERGELEM